MDELDTNKASFDLVCTLLAKKITVATAESCTGGLIAAELTKVSGSSAYFIGGICAYANEAKVNLLGVCKDLLAEYGAVSEPVCEAMCRGAQRAFSSQAAISITGIAGPGGGCQQKPVGSVFIGTGLDDNISVCRHQFTGNRDQIRAQAVVAALKQLQTIITRE